MMKASKIGRDDVTCVTNVDESPTLKVFLTRRFVAVM